MTPQQRPETGGGARALVVALAALTLSGCDELLDVTLPGAVLEETVNDPQYAGLFVQSAVAGFECAFSSYLLLSGSVADELGSAGSTENLLRYDQRTFSPTYPAYSSSTCGASNGGLYTPMSQARWLADEAIRRVEAATEAQVQNRALQLATANVYAGYSYVLFGEGWCSAAFDGGKELQPAEVFALGEQRFAKALELTAGLGTAGANIANLARVGRARVRLDLKNLTGAASDARLVPVGFNFQVTRGAGESTRQNAIYVTGPLTRNASVSRKFWNLTWKGVPDPRVSLTMTTTLALDGQTRMVNPNKYPAEASPMRLASWEEARLIIAEAEGGQAAVDIINDLHTRAGLPPYNPATDGNVVEQVREERRRTLFLEGHRLNDMLRHNISFETGKQEFNQREFGTGTCFPLPTVETDNNTNIKR